MRVDLVAGLEGDADALEARRIIESCVHCGLCTAACPTYELLDHELDSPRGRIYLIREMLQGGPVGARTREHLDRCLSCRACETACPSGVAYGHLIDIGRQVVEQRAPRSLFARARRALLRSVLANGALLRLAMPLAWLVRPWLPAALRVGIPPRPGPAPWPSTRHPRRVLTLRGCVHPVLAPGHDAALARILDRFGVSLVPVDTTACCGALSQHLGAPREAANAMRHNIDAWWPLIEQGAEAIVASSSGCGVMVQDYGHLLRDDPAYAAKARRVSELHRDPAQLLADLWRLQPLELEPLAAGEAAIAYHAPCTQRNGLRSAGIAESLLLRAGYRLAPVGEAHMCCGSAGAYSILQPDISRRLRARKLEHLMATAPRRIVSANIGCILHLGAASRLPVKHWTELLAERLSPKPRSAA